MRRQEWIGFHLLAQEYGISRKDQYESKKWNRKEVLKERLNSFMKHFNFSKKSIVLLSAFLGAIILSFTFYLGVSSGIKNAERGRNITYVNPTSLERQKYESEMKLKEELLDFDENIVDVSIYLGTSDGEITSEGIFIESCEEVTNEDELKLLVSESLNLDMENIDMLSIDVETYTSGKRERRDFDE